MHDRSDVSMSLIKKRDLISTSNLIGCDECDTISKKTPLQKGEKALCPCCGGELYQQTKSLKKLLALVCTAFIVFIIANCYPIVSVELQGNHSETSLIGAVIAMFQINRFFVGTLIFITTFIMPLINILLLFYILYPVSLRKKRPKFLVQAMRLLSSFRIWAMIEVFLIGVLVTLVKLVGMVVVIPGIALWAFAVLSILMIMITSVKLQSIWDEIDRCLI